MSAVDRAREWLKGNASEGMRFGRDPRVMLLIEPHIVADLVDEHDRLRDILHRVGELHKPYTEVGWPDEPYCGTCAYLRESDDQPGHMVHEPWPCPTIRALDGDDDE